MMKFERTKKQYDVYGTVYDVCRPSYDQRTAYAQSLEDKKDEEKGECLLDLLDMCGLPKQVAKEMEQEHLLAIVDDLMPSQGN